MTTTTILSATVVASLGFAVLVAAARDVAQSALTVAEGCEPAIRIQQMVWHRQQSQAYEVDSLTGLVRLFATIADELAAEEAADDAHAAARGKPAVQNEADRAACRARTRPG
jgi:hypothetical protein